MTVTHIVPQESPETPATPRSLEVLLQAVRTELDCPHCGAKPGIGCAYQGRRGVHLNRFVRAYVTRLITVEELAVVLGSREVFTMATIIRPAASEARTAYRLGFDAGRRCGRRDGDR